MRDTFTFGRAISPILNFGTYGYNFFIITVLHSLMPQYKFSRIHHSVEFITKFIH